MLLNKKSKCSSLAQIVYGISRNKKGASFCSAFFRNSTSSSVRQHECWNRQPLRLLLVPRNKWLSIFTKLRKRFVHWYLSLWLYYLYCRWNVSPSVDRYFFFCFCVGFYLRKYVCTLCGKSVGGIRFRGSTGKGFDRWFIKE